MPMQITETVIKVNEEIKRRMIDKIVDLCDGSLNGKTVAVLGVTFKPNTDDMREAPSLTIVPALVGGGAKVRVVDPQGQREGEALLPGVKWVENPYNAVSYTHLDVYKRQAQAPRNFYRLGYSSIAPAKIPEGIARIGRAIRSA